MLGLLTKRSFGSLTLAQFLGALNDNALRQTYLLLAVQAASPEKQAAAAVLFALPFLVFSPLAGQLADRFSKRTVIVFTKFIEIAVMLLAALAMWQQNLLLILISILLMSSQSCFFSPAKYGIIPELLSYEQLSAGNGIIQMSTNIAIMTGTALAGFLLQLTDVFWTGVVLLGLSLLGWTISLLIKPVEPADPELQFTFEPVQRLAKSLAWIRRDYVLFSSMLAFSFVWFVGAFLTLVLNVYGLQALRLGEAGTSLLFVFLATGIGLGSLLAGRWSERKVEFGLIPLGAGGMAGGLMLLSLVETSQLFAYCWLLASGMFSGLFLIPLQATLQERPPAEKKGELLAAANIFSFTAVIAASAIYTLLTNQAGLTSGSLLFLLGLVTLAVGLLLVVILPRVFVRFVLWNLCHTVYRFQLEGRQNVPREGPGLLKVDRFSPLKILQIQFCVPRPVTFITFMPVGKRRFLKLLLSLLNVVEFSPAEREKCFQLAKKKVDKGELVCLATKAIPPEKLREVVGLRGEMVQFTFNRTKNVVTVSK